MANSFINIKKTISSLGEDFTPGGLHMEIFSNKEASVEGCKGILEYSSELIKLNISGGVVSFIGKELYAHSFMGDTIVLKGKIENIDFCVV